MPVTASLVSSAASSAEGTILGTGEAVVGLINAGKAKREAAKLEASRPKYKESPYYKDALSLAQSELSTGMSAEAKNAYEQGISRDLSTSLDAILKGGGSVNNVAQVFDQSQQGRQRLTLMKENLRMNNVNNLVRAQQLNEEQREKAFQFNEWAPWADKAQANAKARQGAEDMIWAGVNTAGASIMKGSSGGGKQMNSFFGGGGQGDGGGNMQASVPSAPSYNQLVPSPADNVGFIDPNSFTHLIGQ